MFINLYKEDLVNLVISQSPSYDDMDKLKKCGLGRYWGGFNDRWEWSRSALEKLSEEVLLDLYSMLQGKLYEFIQEESLMHELFKELHKHGVKMEIKPYYILDTTVVKFIKDDKSYLFMIPNDEIDALIEPTVIEAYILKKLRDFVREVGEGR